MTRSPIRRLVPRTLASVLIVALAVVPAVAGPTAELGGRVLDAGAPAGAVTVHLVEVADGTPAVAASAITDGDGSFAIRDADPGDYRLLVETPAGSFLAPGQVTLDEGTNRPLALTIDAARDHGFGSESAQGLSTWGTWLIAGVIGVAALFVIAEVSDDETPASAF